MVKRSPVKAYLLAAFALFIMVMCWEANKTNAAVIDPIIPEESIRLRILANSDTAEDQNMKRIVRDAVVEQMNAWVTGPHSIEEAREVVRTHLPELEALVGSMLTRYGYDYGYQVELRVVPFPTKMYGDRVYPAGNYEALRVTLGRGEGQNWWCVLFPPLCFVDAAAGEAVAKDKKAEEKAPAVKPSEKPPTVGKPDESRSGKSPSGTSIQVKPTGGKVTASAANAAPQVEPAKEEPKKEVRFFLWDLLKKIVSWVKSLFG